MHIIPGDRSAVRRCLLRAERRTGVLLAELPKTGSADAAVLGGHAKAGTLPAVIVSGASPYAQALTRTGLQDRIARRADLDAAS